MARLVYRGASGQDEAVEINASKPTYVGRAMECSIRTDDAMVSRKHTLIRYVSGQYIVEDLGSSNGTHINDRRITRDPLKNGDILRCGSLVLRFEDDGSPPQGLQPQYGQPPPMPGMGGPPGMGGGMGGQPGMGGGMGGMGGQPGMGGMGGGMAETERRSLHHSCRSELTRQGISLP